VDIFSPSLFIADCRSLFIWRPKDVIEETPEDEDATTEVKKTTKIQIYEADGGKAGRAKGKSNENDDDDFAFMKKKFAAKANGAGSSCTKKEKSKRKSSSGDEDSDDDFDPPPVTPSEGRVLRRRSK